MLLVASVLLSTASFAWLTLANSLEVVGVDTMVGSNGNLEIALNTHELCQCCLSVMWQSSGKLQSHRNVDRTEVLSTFLLLMVAFSTKCGDSDVGNGNSYEIFGAKG